MLIKTPLLHQSLGPSVFLPSFLPHFLPSFLPPSLSFWLIPWSTKAGCITQGILASFLLSLSRCWLWTTRSQSNKGLTSKHTQTASIFLHEFLYWLCAQSLHCVWLFATLWTVAHRAPLSMGIFKQEYWSGLAFHSPGALSDPGIKPVYPVTPALQVDSLLSEP